jgi:nitrite reductase/ring-hydroxylating ferredoxin subunit/uncharacterized membrane protein YphA (DoxX/SURF4 family)
MSRNSRSQSILSTITNSWKNNSWSIRILRLWLGVTFVYAGWNKASDSGFLNPHSTHYIGAQLNSLAASSPVGHILARLVEHAQFIGWVTMLGEFVVGFATLLGILGELAALIGFGISLGLWISVTWSVTPYFLGSDTAYMALWAALGFGLWAEKRKAGSHKKITSLVTDVFQRREFFRALGVGITSVAAIAISSKFQKSAPAAAKGAMDIANLDALPIGSSMKFTAKDGSPALLFRTAAGVFAYSRVCTHQGCWVDYDSASHLLQCPCHGAQYDPANDAKVVGGPAPAPLPKINVAIKGQQIVQL